MSMLDRRTLARPAPWQARRRYPRIHLDYDWVIDSASTSTWGRGLDASLRSAKLPTARPIPEEEVMLYVLLPGRARMFRARGRRLATRDGLVVRFDDVSQDDLRLLAVSLIQTGGLRAVPQLDQKFHRFSGLHRRFLATST